MMHRLSAKTSVWPRAAVYLLLLLQLLLWQSGAAHSYNDVQGSSRPPVCGVSAPVMEFDPPVTNIYDRNSFSPDDRIDYYSKHGSPWQQLYLPCFMRTSFGHFQLHHLGAETSAVAQSSFLRHVLWPPLQCLYSLYSPFLWVSQTETTFWSQYLLSTPGHISMR